MQQIYSFFKLVCFEKAAYTLLFFLDREISVQIYLLVACKLVWEENVFDFCAESKYLLR